MEDMFYYMDDFNHSGTEITISFFEINHYKSQNNNTVY